MIQLSHYSPTLRDGRFCLSSKVSNVCVSHKLEALLHHYAATERNGSKKKNYLFIYLLAFMMFLFGALPSCYLVLYCLAAVQQPAAPLCL